MGNGAPDISKNEKKITKLQQKTDVLQPPSRPVTNKLIWQLLANTECNLSSNYRYLGPLKVNFLVLGLVG